MVATHSPKYDLDRNRRMTFRYCYSGRVLPERACVELPPTSGEIEAPGLLRGRISIQVGCSQVIAIVDLDAELSNVALLKTGIQSLVAARVDAFGYLRALGFESRSPAAWIRTIASRCSECTSKRW